MMSSNNNDPNKNKTHEDLLKEGKKYNKLSSFPENPKTFYNNSEFEFCKTLEDNFEVILSELKKLDVDKDFIDWPESVCDKGTFRLFGFVAFGREIKENCERCPETVKLLKDIPNITSAAFSCQGPQTHLAPHYGYYGYSDLVLRCHLGLICNDKAQIQVGDDLRTWHNGEVFVFDDMITHEAWNKSDENRIILILDFKYNKYNQDPKKVFSYTPELEKLLNVVDKTGKPISMKKNNEKQKECCVKDCYKTVTNRSRFSLRCLKEEDFKEDFIKSDLNKVCHYHYFSDLYKYKKTLSNNGQTNLIKIQKKTSRKPKKINVKIENNDVNNNNINDNNNLILLSKISSEIFDK